MGQSSWVRVPSCASHILKGVYTASQSYLHAHACHHTQARATMEYVAQFHANKKAQSIRNLFSEMGGALAKLVERPILLLGDNDPATKIAKEMKATSKTKHWLLKYHLCRYNFRTGITLPLRVPTKDNESDTGTKCESAPDFARLVPRLKGYASSYTPPEWEPLPLPA
jgi:hypothetical protein